MQLFRTDLRTMIDAQFPEWVSLPIVELRSYGTVNSLYRLGNDLLIRLPKSYSGYKQLQKEVEWLPKIAKHLPVKVPKFIALGKPTETFPWNWSVLEWIEGENLVFSKIADRSHGIGILSDFMKTIQKIRVSDELLPGVHNFNRGEPLINRDDATRSSIFELKGLINPEIAIKVWEDALEATDHHEKVLIHGDLHEGNILMHNGKINAVIDFGGLGVGDRACDLIPAWNMMDDKSRKAFRKNLNIDEMTWKRGRGWALSMSVIALAYYLNTSNELVRISKYAISEITNEF